MIKNNHNNFIVCLKEEIAKLEVLLASKNQEIEQLIKEKSQNRHLADTENGRLRL